MPLDQTTGTKVRPTVHAFLSSLRIAGVSRHASEMSGPASICTIICVSAGVIGRQLEAKGGRPWSSPTTVTVFGRTPSGSPKLPIKFTVWISFGSFGGDYRAHVGVTVVPSVRVITKSVTWIVVGLINQLNVTGMLSRPFSPVGQAIVIV